MGAPSIRHITSEAPFPDVTSTSTDVHGGSIEKVRLVVDVAVEVGASKEFSTMASIAPPNQPYEDTTYDASRSRLDVQGA